MKFGQQLATAELPEWKGEYFPYRHFKHKLEAIAQGAADTRSPRRGGASPAISRRPTGETLDSFPSADNTFALGSVEEAAAVWRGRVLGEAKRICDRVKRDVEELRAQLADLVSLVRKEQEHERTEQECGADVAVGMTADPLIPMVVEGGLSLDGANRSCSVRGGIASGSVSPEPSQPPTLDQSVRRRWRQPQPRQGRSKPLGQTSDDFLKLRVLSGLHQLRESVKRLREFRDWNQAGMFKIYKKYDKLLHTKEGLSLHYGATLLESGLRSCTPLLDDLDLDIKTALQEYSRHGGAEASVEVVQIAAGLHTVVNRQQEQRLFFCLGFLVAMVLSILVLILLPCKDPDTFSSSYFLSSLSVFRLIIAVALVFWGCGAVAEACKSYAINANFILDIDPRCKVGPPFFFRQAAVLSSLWILIFGAYVVDYKWMVLPVIWSTSGFNDRSSFHFVLYPSFLFLFTIMMMGMPSALCRYRYRKQLLGGIWRTCAAPFYHVSFGDNLIGDVMTSLAKPLMDIPTSFCYFASHHPQTSVSVTRFKEYGNTCPEWEHQFLRPIINGAPFVFRLFQCLRRFMDTKEPKHLLNFGKYLASLLVVVVSNCLGQESWAVLAITIFATFYAWTWDVHMDWGLGAKELFTKQNGRSTILVSPPTSPPVQPNPDPLVSAASVGFEGTEGAAERGSGRGLVADLREPLRLGPEATELAQDLSSPRSPASPVPVRAGSVRWRAKEQGKRRFGRRFYWTAVILDMIGRLTWTISLMPITIFSDDIVQRSVLEMITTVAEIFRRSLWSVIRIEYEQASNASGFRALLWVPILMKDD